MLSDNVLDLYLSDKTEEQVASIRAVRALIIEIAPNLIEEIDTGKWFGGLLTYYTEDRVFGYALGPLKGGYTTFHMMPYYSSTVLQERNGAALKKVLSGKSCIKFKDFSQVPEDSLRDIIGAMPKYAEIAREMLARRKK